jgi:hypothetical protein
MSNETKIIFIFIYFLKCWPNSHGFNKLVIKSKKKHAIKTFFFILTMQNHSSYYLFILFLCKYDFILMILSHMHTNKTTFVCIFLRNFDFFGIFQQKAGNLILSQYLTI